MSRTPYIALAICVAALIYLKKGWESIDIQNVTPENVIVLLLLIVLVIIGLIFLSPYLKGKKLAFREGKPDKGKIYGGKDIT
jgi:ABC-type Fe3+-siderophore transport system permease subunit